jgi:hypothetical protein
LLNILVKEGFARSASTKERRCLKPFHKAKGEVVEELSQVQGVHLRCCKFTLQAQEGRARNCQEGKRSLTEELGTLEVFKPSKVTEELHRTSARSAERVSRTV